MNTSLNAEKRQFITNARNKRIWSPFLNNILQEMEECRELSKCGGEPVCMLCWGDTGAGKTALIEKYRSDHKRYETKVGSVLPVVYATLPTKVTEKGLVINILKAINQEIEDYDSLDVSDLIAILVDYVERLGIELFIIDEAQGFLEHESRKLVYDGTECVKKMIIATGRPFILFGMPWCLYAIEQNSQLASRFLRRRHLEPFIISNAEKRAGYLTFLGMLDEGLGFPELSGLNEEKIALRLFSVSRGNLRVLRNVIDQAALIAVKERTSKIGYTQFERACETFFPGDKNPFSIQSLERVRFVELAKPSYWDKDAKRGVNPVVEQTYTKEQTLSSVLSAS